MGLDSLFEDKGVEPGTNDRRKYSNTFIFECLQECSSDGEITREEYQKKRTDKMPASATIEKRFETWNNAVKQAGLSENTSKYRWEPNVDMSIWNKQKSYIIGVLIGDGSVNKSSRGKKQISLFTVDQEFRDKFLDDICEWLNVDDDRFEYGITEKDDKNHQDQYYCKKTSAALFDELYEYTYNERHWITWINKLDSEERKYILKGLWDSEGTVLKRDSTNELRIGFSSTEEWIIQLYLTLLVDVVNLSLGSYTTSASGDPKTYRVMINEGEYNNKFINTVSPTITRKTEEF